MASDTTPQTTPQSAVDAREPLARFLWNAFKATGHDWWGDRKFAPNENERERYLNEAEIFARWLRSIGWLDPGEVVELQSEHDRYKAEARMFAADRTQLSRELTVFGEEYGKLHMERDVALGDLATLRDENASLAAQLDEAEKQRDEGERSRQHWEEEARLYAQNAGYWQKRAVEAEVRREQQLGEDGRRIVQLGVNVETLTEERDEARTRLTAHEQLVGVVANLVSLVCVVGNHSPIDAEVGCEVCKAVIATCEVLDQLRTPTPVSPPAEALAAVRTRFWVCPVREHRRRVDHRGGPVITVEWVDGVGRCTAPGCDRTSRVCTCPWNNGYVLADDLGHHLNCPTLTGKHEPMDGCGPRGHRDKPLSGYLVRTCPTCGSRHRENVPADREDCPDSWHTPSATETEDGA